MAIKRYPLAYHFMVALFLASCTTEYPQVSSTADHGYRPVYGTTDHMTIKMISSQPVQRPGKIYRYGNYLLINELNKGIHVFDNSNPSSPVAVGYLQMLGNSDMAIKDGKLYADHIGSLVALALNDFGVVEEKGRLSLRDWQTGVPPPPGFYFQCVEEEKGIVISWEKTELNELQCYAIR